MKHKHVIVENEPSRRLVSRLTAYLRHLADLQHPNPEVDPGYHIPLPGVGAVGLLVYPAFRGPDPQTGRMIDAPRIAMPGVLFTGAAMSRDAFLSTAFGRWLAKTDPECVSVHLAFSDMLATNFRAHPELSLHIFGFGIFMNAEGLQLFSASPELLFVLNGRAPFMPTDRDLRVPRKITEGLPDNALCALTVDHLWHSVPQHPGIAARLFGDRVSPGQQYVLATSWLLKAVMTGGFAQFFFTPIGDLAVVALTALEHIGATRYAQVMRRALSVFGREYPVDLRLRAQYLEQQDRIQVEQMFDEASQEMLALTAADPLDVRMADYIRHNPAEFVR